MDESNYTRHEINSLEQLISFKDPADLKWIFRGEDSDRPFQTTFERACRQWTDISNTKEIENKLIYEFQRRAHLYVPNPPPAVDDTMEWLALMQHYGAPTRLLDWTYSLFIATFFALEKVKDEKKVKDEAIVWAINTDWIDLEPKKIIRASIGEKWLKEWVDKRTGKAFDKVFRKHNALFVHRTNPHILNQRLSTQQGLFLCPGSISKSFEDNILALPNSQKNIYKICIPLRIREELILRLHRMNINAESLFPGLDGFARSLWTRLPILSRINIKYRKLT